jgi:hypothetical protein
MINLTGRNRILAVTRPEEISSGDACAGTPVRRRATSECIRRVPADTRACFSSRGLNEIRDGGIKSKTFRARAAKLSGSDPESSVALISKVDYFPVSGATTKHLL